MNNDVNIRMNNDANLSFKTIKNTFSSQNFQQNVNNLESLNSFIFDPMNQLAAFTYYHTALFKQ